MRKRIALILAVAMLFSMIVPMSASAASSNRVTNVPTVQEDDKLIVNPPQLVIEEEGRDFGQDGTTQYFTLRLENAEWLADGDEDVEKVMEDAGHPAGPNFNFEAAMEAHIETDGIEIVSVTRN